MRIYIIFESRCFFSILVIWLNVPVVHIFLQFHFIHIMIFRRSMILFAILSLGFFFCLLQWNADREKSLRQSTSISTRLRLIKNKKSTRDEKRRSKKKVKKVNKRQMHSSSLTAPSVPFLLVCYFLLLLLFFCFGLPYRVKWLLILVFTLLFSFVFVSNLTNWWVCVCA